ncbi:MAG: hypothetical protein SNJ77_04235 [Cytophagales bacterium]
MKKSLNIVLILLLVLCSSFSSIRQFLITSNKWRCVSVSNHDSTMVNPEFSKIVMRFEPNGKMWLFHDTTQSDADWQFNNNETKILIKSKDDQNLVFDILSISSDTLHLKLKIIHPETQLFDSIQIKLKNEGLPIGY